MPRGAFNTTMDIWSGPSTPFPVLRWIAVPCRLVVADEISLASIAAPFRYAWATLDVTHPNDSFVGPGKQYIPSRADQIAIPSGTPVQWWVIYTDLVVSDEGTPYYRANLSPLPLPLPVPIRPESNWPLGNARIVLSADSGIDTTPRTPLLRLSAISSIT